MSAERPTPSVGASLARERLALDQVLATIENDQHALADEPLDEARNRIVRPDAAAKRRGESAGYQRRSR